MKIFTGNKRELPEKHIDERGESFDHDVGHFNENGGLELLAHAGVKYHPDFFAALSGALEPLVAEVAESSSEKDKGKPAPSENKSKTPATDNK